MTRHLAPSLQIPNQVDDNLTSVACWSYAPQLSSCSIGSSTSEVFFFEHVLYFRAYCVHYTLPTAELLSGKNARAFLVCGFLMKSYKKNILNIRKKSWEFFGLDWLCYLAGNFQMAPTIFFIFSGYFLSMNPQTRNARAFLTLNISAVGSVFSYLYTVQW